MKVARIRREWISLPLPKGQEEISVDLAAGERVLSAQLIVDDDYHQSVVVFIIRGTADGPE